MVQQKAAIAVLVNSKKQILLHLRDDKPGIICPGYWAFVGGGVEDGESELEAVKREIKEEINLTIEDIHYLDKIYVKEEEIMVSVFLGKLDMDDREIKVSEGQGVKFFYPSEINSLKMMNILKEMIFSHLETILAAANS